MRRPTCTLLLFGAALMPAAADMPFAPRPDVPDHVIAFVERAIHRKEEHTRIVTRHGDWTRIDRFEGRNRASEFHNHRRLTSIRIRGPGPNFYLVRGEGSPHTDNVPRNTGERQTHLGESCAVWNVRRMKNHGPGGLTSYSCVTDDGVELWTKAIGNNKLISSSEATRIERRPVAPDEARPPRALIDLDWWDRDETGPIKPTYETAMAQSGSTVDVGRRVRITRQHPVWLWVEESVDGLLRSLQVRSRMQFSVSTDDGAEPKRLIVGQSVAPPPNAPKGEPGAWAPKDLGRDETVLGERCRWFDMTPGLMDAGMQACRTPDGITLKEVATSWSSETVWTR